MKKNKKRIMGALTIALFLALCIIFRRFLFDYALLPLVTSFWYMLRILVFSIHQAILWYALIGGMGLYLLFRYLWGELRPSPVEEYTPENLHLQKWRSLTASIEHSKNEPYYQQNLKEELITMIVTLYAAEKRLSANYVLYDQFKTGKIALPEEIHTFLYTHDKEKLSWLVRLRREKYRGRRDREFEKCIETCLSWLENRMELSSARKENHYDC